MTFNPRATFSLDLSLFGSWVEDIQPTDLPPGGSPDNSDCFYLPGGVFTRPALKKVLATPVEGTPTIVSVKDFEVPTGDDLMMFLDSGGNLYSNLADDPTVTTLLSLVAPGVQFKAETAFGKQWYAFYSYLQSAGFSDNPFVGVDVPLYYNGTNLFRVTSDPPGVPPVFTSVPTIPQALEGIAGGQSVTISSYSTSGTKQYYTPPSGRGAFQEPGYWTTYYTLVIFNCTGAVPASWVGLNVAVSGLSHAPYPGLNGSLYVESVSGDSFTVAFTSYVPYNVTDSGTAALGSTTLLQRTNNIVTAWLGGLTLPTQFQLGFWISLLNTDGSLINGPLWTITEISRDTSGLVTVTISTQLANLPVGAQLYINASDSTDFPVGYQTVYQVISAAAGRTIFTYQSLDTTAASSSSGGSVYQTWSPQSGTNGSAAQITAVGIDPNNGAFIQFFQLGPNASLAAGQGTISSPMAQIQSQAAAGPRSAVVMFKSADGAITAPSVPATLATLGGGNLLFAQDIPIGPPGTAQRIIAFTPSEGANFYYITPASGSRIGASAPTIASGTIVADNVTSSLVLDFSDAQLVAGTQIDIAGNDLFNQVVLAPMLGVIEYQGRMAWWGEINNVKNFLNMGFDGGYLPPTGEVSIYGRNVIWNSGAQFNPAWAGSEIIIGGVPYTIASIQSSTQLTLTVSSGLTYGFFPYTVLNCIGTLPPGWDASQGDGAGTLVPYSELQTEFGFAYQMATGFNNHIQQGASTDFFGGPILQAGTPYTVRLKGKTVAPDTSGDLIVNVYSATAGGVIATATFPIADFVGSVFVWNAVNFDKTLPAVLPSDAILEIYLLDTVAGGMITIDEVEPIYSNQPVSFDQARLSYFQNPFGYDSISGVLSVDPSENLTAAFRQRGYLYFISDESLFQTVNNGTGEPDTWDVTQYVGVCGCSGPNAVDFGEEFAIWAGRYGGREFTGDPSAKKITQEFSRTWESINWTAQTTIWVKNDPVDRLIFFGIPTTTAAAMPNKVIQMSYRLNDAAYNVPDPIHVSSYSGKLIVTDLGRRWSPWQITLNCADMCIRELATGLAKTIVFGGGNGLAPGAAAGFGNLYTLDTANYWPLNPDVDVWNCTDDDYGGIDSFYTTYFFFPRDLEQNPLVKQFRKIFNFVTVHATGVGSLKITPVIDALTNTQKPFPLTPLSLTDPGFDLEFHAITKGNRVAYRLEPYIGPPGVGKAMAITQMSVSGRQDNIFPVRGTVFSG